MHQARVAFLRAIFGLVNVPLCVTAVPTVFRKLGLLWVKSTYAGCRADTPAYRQQADDFTKTLPVCPQHVRSPPALLRGLLRRRPGQECQERL